MFKLKKSFTSETGIGWIGFLGAMLVMSVFSIADFFRKSRASAMDSSEITRVMSRDTFGLDDER